MSDRTPPHPDRTRAGHWLSALAHRFPDVVDALEHGHHTPTGRRERGRGADRRGPSTPLRVTVCDTLRTVTDRVVALDDAVHDRLGLPPAGRATVPERLTRIAGLLDAVEADRELLRHVLDEVSALLLRCCRELGESEPVVRLPGRCPLCDSVSLREFPLRSAVACINPACRCAIPDCPCHNGTGQHRHAWPERDWPGLGDPGGVPADVLTAASTGRAALVGGEAG